MGIMKRFMAKLVEAGQQSTPVAVGDIDLSRSTAAQNEVIVVGSENYDGLRSVRREGPVSGVTLRPEPKNKYDRNAVAVYIGRTKAGYLSASRAKAYRPTITASTPVSAHARRAGGSLTLFVMLPRLRK